MASKEVASWAREALQHTASLNLRDDADDSSVMSQSHLDADAALRWACQQPGALQKVTAAYLGWCGELSDLGLKYLGIAIPGLKELHVAECERVRDGGIEALAAACPGLHTVVISSCYNLTSRSVQALAEACGDGLQVLQADWTSVDDAALHALGEHCVNLECLDLTGVTGVNDIGISALAYRTSKAFKLGDPEFRPSLVTLYSRCIHATFTLY